MTCESETRVQPIAEVSPSIVFGMTLFLVLTKFKWADGGLHPIMLENIKLCLYDRPTAIQMYTIPAMKMEKDLIAVSQTGECSILTLPDIGL